MAPVPVGGPSRTRTSGSRPGTSCAARRRPARGHSGAARRRGWRSLRRGRRYGRLPHRRIVLRAGAAGCRPGVVPCAPVRAARAGGWCSFGSMRAGRPHRVVPGRAGPPRSVLVPGRMNSPRVVLGRAGAVVAVPAPARRVRTGGR
ncbi:hypothetical protein J2Z78_002513 [Streptomyces griseorubens]